MAEVAIRLYGPGPSFDPKAGTLTALVEVEGGTSAYLVDRERGRARLDAIPGGDADKWTSARGVLLLARLGWWGLSARMDRLPSPIDPGEPAAPDRPDRKRPYLPRDLASCPRCHRVVILERDRRGPGFRLATPSRRLARHVREVLRAAGLLSCIADATGKGRRAGRDHAVDCYGLDLFRPFPDPPRRRGRGRPRADPRPEVPLPWKAKPSP